MIILSFMVLHNAFGKLRNGYHQNIDYVCESLRIYYYNISTGKNLSTLDKRKMKARMVKLVTYQSYYELTESLLNQFRIISPALYDAIDSMSDARGRSVDVYVKFIPPEQGLVQAAGTTYMAQANDDDDACVSEYGKNTVSIKVWTVSRALLVLSHEFGHVYYQVPHLAVYTEYYKNMYPGSTRVSNDVGHDFTDISGKHANAYEIKFKEDYHRHIKVNKSNDDWKSPASLVQVIKKQLRSELRCSYFSVTTFKRKDKMHLPML